MDIRSNKSARFGGGSEPPSPKFPSEKNVSY